MGRIIFHIFLAVINAWCVWYWSGKFNTMPVPAVLLFLLCMVAAIFNGVIAIGLYSQHDHVR